MINKMGKRKTIKKQIKNKSPKISTIFDCPYCNHKKGVEAKM